MQKNIFFPIEEYVTLINAIRDFNSNPNEQNTIQANTIREAVLDHIENIESRDELISLFNTNFVEIYTLLMNSYLIEKAIPKIVYRETEDDIISKKAFLLKKEKKILAKILQKRASVDDLYIEINEIPGWMFDLYIQYTFHTREIFTQIGESNIYFSFINKAYKQLLYLISDSQAQRLLKKNEGVIQKSLKLHTLYFNESNLIEINKSRSSILKKILLNHNYPLDYSFKISDNASKIKVGVYDPSLADRTETYANLPFLKLDKDKFEITLITENKPAHSKLLNYCKSFTENIVILSKTLIEAVNTIRKLDLDYIIIGCNISASTSFSHLIFQHKLARKHIATFCSPISTALDTSDYFLLGNHIKYDKIESDFTEKLIFTSGSPGCLDMRGSTQDASEMLISKATYQIPEQATLFISAAVCYKILPEIQELWIKLLSLTPNSYLLLHPFNPNWNSKYPEQLFSSSIDYFLKKYKVEPNRLKIDHTKFKSRTDLKQLIKIGDIYLDTFPYSSFVSLTEVLECGIPPIVFRGKTMRGRQGSALLIDLGLETLIVESNEEYMNKALSLYNNKDYRNRCSNIISVQMAAEPDFYNSNKYAKEVSGILYELRKVDKMQILRNLE